MNGRDLVFVHGFDSASTRFGRRFTKLTLRRFVYYSWVDFASLTAGHNRWVDFASLTLYHPWLQRTRGGVRHLGYRDTASQATREERGICSGLGAAFRVRTPHSLPLHCCDTASQATHEECGICSGLSVA